MTDRERRLRRVESAYASVARETARKIAAAQARKADTLTAHGEMRDALSRMPQLQGVLGYGRHLARMEAEIARQEQDLAWLTRACIDSLLRGKVARGLLEAMEAEAVSRRHSELIAEIATLLAGASLPQDGPR